MLTWMTAAFAIALGVAFVVRGARRLADGLRDAASLQVIRGIRSLVVGASAGAVAVGLLTGRTGLLILASVFLAEELYETGVVALIIRAGECPD